jgi:hypothetical protein
MQIPGPDSGISCRKPGIALSSAILICLLAGCALDYESEHLASQLSGDLPETVMYGYRQTTVQRHKPFLEVEAAKVEAYTQKRLISMETVEIVEYSKAGDALTRMSIGEAEYDIEPDILHLNKGVQIRRYEGDSIWDLEGEQFSFFQEEHQLTAPEDSIVVFREGERGELSGKGFSAETDSGTVHFTDKVSGFFISEESNDHTE